MMTAASSPQWSPPPDEFTLLPNATVSQPPGYVRQPTRQLPTPVTPTLTDNPRPPPPHHPQSPQTISPQLTHRIHSAQRHIIDPSLSSIPKVVHPAQSTVISPPRDTLSAASPCHCTQKLSALLPQLLPAPNSLPFDTILSQNKSTLKSLSSLIPCPEPSEATFIFILAAVVTKILDRYAAAPQLSHISSGSADPTNSASKLDLNDHRNPHAGIRPTTEPTNASPNSTPRLKLDFLEHEDEDRLKTHIVLNELRKVDSLLIGFADRFKRASSSTSPSHSSFSSSSGVIIPSRDPESTFGEQSNSTTGHNLHRPGIPTDASGSPVASSYPPAFFTETITVLRKQLRALVEQLQREVRIEFAGLE